MTNTENYGLNLPDDEDFYNIEDFNGNMEAIDMALYEMEQRIDNGAQESTVEEISKKIGKGEGTLFDLIAAKAAEIIGAKALKSDSSFINLVASGYATGNAPVTYTGSGMLYMTVYYAGSGYGLTVNIDGKGDMELTSLIYGNSTQLLKFKFDKSIYISGKYNNGANYFIFN